MMKKIFLAIFIMIYASSGYADNLSCNRDIDQIKGLVISELEIMKSGTAEQLINWYNKKRL